MVLLECNASLMSLSIVMRKCHHLMMLSLYFFFLELVWSSRTAPLVVMEVLD